MYVWSVTKRYRWMFRDKVKIWLLMSRKALRASTEVSFTEGGLRLSSILVKFHHSHRFLMLYLTFGTHIFKESVL